MSTSLFLSSLLRRPAFIKSHSLTCKHGQRGRAWRFVLCVSVIDIFVMEWQTMTCGQTFDNLNIMRSTVLGCKAELGVLSWSSASFHCLPQSPELRQKCLDFIYRHQVDMPTNQEGPPASAEHILARTGSRISHRNPWVLPKCLLLSLTLYHRCMLGCQQVGVCISNRYLLKKKPVS